MMIWIVNNNLQISIKHQRLFSGENKKNIMNLLSGISPDSIKPLKRQSQLQQTTILTIFFICQREQVLTFHVNCLPSR